MKKSLLVVFLVMGFAAIACNLFSSDRVNTDADETALAQSVDATLTANAPPPPPAASPTRQSAPSHTPRNETSTAIPPTQPPLPAQTATPSQPTVGAITFASSVTSDDQPQDPGTRFKKGTHKIYAFFPYCGIKPGTKMTLYWFVNGKEFVSDVEVFPESCGNWYYYIHYTDNSPLDSGRWELKVFAESKLMQSGEFQIFR